MTEPIDQATKDRIEKEAIAFADSIEVNSIATHTGLVKGYIAGATIWAKKLKQERDKVIDECIYILENETGDTNAVPLLESLKDKSHE